MKNKRNRRRLAANHNRPGSETPTRETDRNVLEFVIGDAFEAFGVLELHPNGYGFLRDPGKNLRRFSQDPYVPEGMIKNFSLREGVSINGEAKSVRSSSGPKLVSIQKIDGFEPANYRSIDSFDELTPSHPKRWLRLERNDPSVGMRVLDLLCPLGLGQRALIASPPRAGKTTLLKEIGRSISENHPDLLLKVLLIDERPEEVTEIKSEINGEVFASDLDHAVSNHVRLSRLVIRRCKRLAEQGKNVLLLVDSLTRLARACNKLPGPAGPIASGGLRIGALEFPRKLFSAARPFVEGGSLTIVATILIDTENRMDEAIFREFKGTGNLDLVLSQQLADRRVFPAVDIAETATRRVELLHDRQTFNAVTALRNMLLGMHPQDATRELIRKLDGFQSNSDFVKLINGAR